MSLKDALRAQTLTSMWEEFHNSTIADEVPAEEVESRREAFVAGTMGLLATEKAARGQLTVSQIRELMDRLSAEGSALAEQILARHMRDLGNAKGRLDG